MQEKLEKEKSQAEVKSTSTHEEPSKYLYRELPIRNAYKAPYSSIRGVTFFGDQFIVCLNIFASFCFYLKYSSSHNQRVIQRVKKTFFCQNLFQIMYNQKQKSNVHLRKKHKTADRKGALGDNPFST